MKLVLPTPAVGRRKRKKQPVRVRTENNGLRLVLRTHTSKKGRLYTRRLKLRKNPAGRWVRR